MSSSNILRSRTFMMKAHEWNMTGPDYVYMVPWLIKSTVGPYTRYPWNDTDSLKAYQQTFVHVAEGLDDETVFSFWKKLDNKTRTDPKYNFSTHLLYANYLITKFDSIYLYGLALNECLALNGCDWRSGRDIFHRCKYKQFYGQPQCKCIGASGHVFLNELSERVPGFFVEALSDGGRLRKVFHLDVMQDQKGHIYREVHQVGEKFDWNTHDGLAPPDMPPCGFSGELCPIDYALYYILAALIFIAIISLAIFLFYQQRRKAFEEQLLAKTWQLQETDLSFAGEAISMSLRHLGSLHDPTLKSTGTLVSKSGMNNQDEKEEFSLGFDRVAFCKGQKVGVKKYTRLDNLIIKARKDLLLLKSLKDLQHNNLNSFIGMCMSFRKNSMVVVWSFCSKGSLADVLYNDEIQLDMTFKASILKDIIRGLQYLHQSPIGLHGFLSTHNCLIDSHWVVKLTDFGVSKILNDWTKSKLIAKKGNLSVENLFHLAPEILRTEKGSIIYGQPTPEGDVYSFGMVQYQVLYRDNVFDTEILAPEEILSDLKTTVMPGEPPKLRPTIPDSSEMNMDIVDLMKSCWAEEAHSRPTLKTVHSVIFRSLLKYSENVVDHMTKMMSAYAENLEKMVASRTKQLFEERQRADELLGRMLPKSVAEKLKNGLEVPPESFESVSVLFSDIVSFTALCGQSTPIQTVEMLNGLFSYFDATIEKFDAYKGLTNFDVPHIIGRKICVRIGIHTGPVAAGVVGLTMPRYCLFGDTVNVASRMESTGKAMQIQVSQSSKELIDQCDKSKYSLEFRGKTMLKGKGLCDTYWLEHPTEAAVTNNPEGLYFNYVNKQLGEGVG